MMVPAPHFLRYPVRKYGMKCQGKYDAVVSNSTHVTVCTDIAMIYVSIIQATCQVSDIFYSHTL